jgi:uncharacterized phosphosugar-binding protein
VSREYVLERLVRAAHNVCAKLHKDRALWCFECGSDFPAAEALLDQQGRLRCPECMAGDLVLHDRSDNPDWAPQVAREIKEG